MLKVEYYFSILILLVLLLCGMTVVYWLFVDVDPPVRHTAVTTMDNWGKETTRFKRGDTLVVKREGCYTEDIELFFSRVLLSEDKKLSYVTSGNRIFVQEGCRSSIFTATIPPYIKPGEYQYIVNVYYTNNPLVSGRVTLPIPTIHID